MIAEEYLGRSRLFRHLKSGPHGQVVELYAKRLIKEGLAGHGTWRCLNLVRDLLGWITRSRSTVTDVDERMVERYLRHRGRKQSIQPGCRVSLTTAVRLFHFSGPIHTRPRGTALPGSLCGTFVGVGHRQRSAALRQLQRCRERFR